MGRTETNEDGRLMGRDSLLVGWFGSDLKITTTASRLYAGRYAFANKTTTAAPDGLVVVVKERDARRGYLP